jgi:hypothetical protein
MPSWGPDLVNKLILISISIRKNCIRMVFCLFCKNNFYLALFTLLYFIILVVATTFWWGTTKSRYKWTIQYSLRSMVILRFFGENSPWIIAALGADPAVLKTGCQALVCQFVPNLYTNFTKLSNTPLIRQCALICTHSQCILQRD